MLTAREEEAERLAGFEAGADDYMVKPFSVRELMHRIRSILRRRETGASAPATIQTTPAATPSRAEGPYRRFDVRLQVDPGVNRIWIDGAEAVARESEFAVLQRLLTRRTTAESRRGGSIAFSRMKAMSYAVGSRNRSTPDSGKFIKSPALLHPVFTIISYLSAWRTATRQHA